MKFSRVLVLLFGLLSGPTLRSAEDPKWVQGSTEHFSLVTDTTEAKAQRLLSDLEARLAGFSDAFGKLRPLQFPIQVFLFRNRDDFLPAMPKLPPTAAGDPAPERNAYALTGPDRIFILAKDKSPEDIANDAGHALGHVLFEHQVMWRPFWLAEGVAEYVRRMGRDADTKAVPEKESFSVEDILTIVPSTTYQDSAPGGGFRTQSYRLLRLVLQEKPQALREFLAALAKEDGSAAKLNVDGEDLSKKLETFAETPLKLSPAAPVKITPIELPAVAIRRGDLLLAAGRTSDANGWYKADSGDARAGRAVVTRFSRTLAEALQSLSRAALELPENGLVQYHFGALAADNPKAIEAQVASLEKAIRLLPLFGRAHAELARVYTLSGKPDSAFGLIDRALELEPGFADHFYEIKAEALFGLRRYDDAVAALRIADALPHSDRNTVEAFTQKLAALTRRIETARRAADAQRLERIRRDVEAKVNAVEPAQIPKPVPPVREGRIDYELTASGPVEVVNAVYPEYPGPLRKLEKTGRIVLRVNVGPDGQVKNAVVSSSQIPDLNAATIEAAKKWTFKVPQRARPISTNVTITFIYALQ